MKNLIIILTLTVLTTNFGEASEMDCCRHNCKALYTLVISPDERYFVTAGAERVIKLWDLETYELLYEFPALEQSISAIAFSPDGKYLISGTNAEDADVQLWDLESKELLHLFNGHERSISALAFRPDSIEFISGSLEATAKVWNVENRALVSTITPEENSSGFPVKSIVISDDNERLFLTIFSVVKMWDLGNAEMLHEFSSDPWLYSLDIVVISDKYETLVAAGSSNEVFIWDLKSKELRRKLELPGEDTIRALTLSHDEQFLFASNDRNIYQWKTDTLELVGFYKLPATMRVSGLDVTKDNERLLASVSQSNIMVWDLVKKELAHTIDGEDTMCDQMKLYMVD